MMQHNPDRVKMGPFMYAGAHTEERYPACTRIYCGCCGGSRGVRAAYRERDNSKRKTLRTHRTGVRV